MKRLHSKEIRMSTSIILRKIMIRGGFFLHRIGCFTLFIISHHIAISI